MISDHFKNIKLFVDYLKDNDVTNHSAEKLAEVALNISSPDPKEKTVEIVKVLTSPVHLPTRIFWYKVKRFLSGTFHDFNDQLKMASRFDPTNDDYPKYIEKLIYTIDQTDDDKKIDWVASLTRAFLLELIDESLFWKLTQYLKLCTSDELEFMRSCPDEYAEPLNVMVSALYYYGLFEQHTGAKGEAIYKLSTFGKALKMNCLNFERELHDKARITGYADLDPVSIQEPMTEDDLNKILGESTVENGVLHLGR